MRLGRAFRRPDLGFRLNYEREQFDTIFLGGLTVTIPAFQRGQGTLAAGLARKSRVRTELEATRQAALSEVRTVYQVHAQRVQLAEALTRDALASVVDNESLARRSYDAGELNLMDVLLIRRDALETRTTVVDRRLDAALSRLQVDFASGVLR
jgi:cobalt-zinc-cadmium efflux system outer membrane protein